MLFYKTLLGKKPKQQISELKVYCNFRNGY